MQRDRIPYIFLPIVALIAVLPLILHGCSCGHDFDFHILNWLEAARQFTHGNLHPHWAYTPAWNAGEPRFVFYPPFSWTIGALLGLTLPWTWTPIVYTWLALTASGLALHHLTRNFTTPTAALLAATFYVVNPYMLFTAYERTAYAELLAAAWIPLLLHAILRKRVTIPGIAIPVALLWLTNAPAAVMSCYALALLTLIRIANTAKYPAAPSPGLASSPITNPSSATPNPSSQTPGPSSPAPGSSSPAPGPSSPVLGAPSRASATAPAHSNTSNASSQTPLRIAFNTAAGTLLGLGVAAFYILPAAYERRYVQIAMAILPGMRIQDNFLFHQTGEILHDQVLHTASLIAVTLLATTVIVLTTLRLTSKVRVPNPSHSHPDGGGPQHSTNLLIPLTILTTAIALLLTPITAFIWNHAPELAFLQFPWRILAILAAILSLTIALALSHVKLKPIPTAAVVLAIASALTYPAYNIFHQPCDDEDTVQAREALFHSNQGTDPTDEYTPTTADNDSLAHANPAFWLSTDPDAKAPANAVPGPAPTQLTLNSPTPQTIILNLRDYPTWRVTLNQTLITIREERDDGLIAIPIPAGPFTIDITYAQPLDQTIGDILSLLSIALLLLSLTLKPSIRPHEPAITNQLR
jgi:hypothetical protein